MIMGIYKKRIPLSKGVAKDNYENSKDLHLVLIIQNNIGKLKGGLVSPLFDDNRIAPRLRAPAPYTATGITAFQSLYS